MSYYIQINNITVDTKIEQASIATVENRVIVHLSEGVAGGGEHSFELPVTIAEKLRDEIDGAIDSLNLAEESK